MKNASVNMEYKIEQVKTDDASLQKVKECLEASFPEATKFTMDFLRWQYRDNPLGEIVGFNAVCADGTLAAHYATMPIEMMIAGRKSRGLLSLNTATHPNHRGKRLFTLLASKTYEYAAENGFEFVIGVANANSTHGFVKHLGFTLVSPLRVRFGLGTETVNKQFEFERVWNKETLAWRLACPGATYYRKSNRLYGKRSLGRKDMLGVINDETLLPRNMKKTFRPISLYVGLGADLSGMMFKLPKFVKISPFNLIWRDLTGGKLPKLTKDNILFQLLDFDVV